MINIERKELNEVTKIKSKNKADKKEKKAKMKQLSLEIDNKRKEFWKMNLDSLVDDFLDLVF